MKNIPQKIYLQAGHKNPVTDFKMLSLDDITWSSTRENDTDIEYDLFNNDLKRKINYEQQYRYNKLKAFAQRLDTNNNESYNLTAEEATWIREIITNTVERLESKITALKNMETSSRIISESEKSAKINCKHEVDQDKCTICNDPQCKRTALDLDELERKLDQALNNETPKSLKKWIQSKRSNER